MNNVPTGDTLAEKQWVFPEDSQPSLEAAKPPIERFSKV